MVALISFVLNLAASLFKPRSRLEAENAALRHQLIVLQRIACSSSSSIANTARTHRSLNKDAPVSRRVQQSGRIVSHALLGGLHHQYVGKLTKFDAEVLVVMQS
jgi:hypothetical protein